MDQISLQWSTWGFSLYEKSWNIKCDLQKNMFAAKFTPITAKSTQCTRNLDTWSATRNKHQQSGNNTFAKRQYPTIIQYPTNNTPQTSNAKMNSRNRTYEEAFPELPSCKIHHLPRCNQFPKPPRPIVTPNFQTVQRCRSVAKNRPAEARASARSRHGRSSRSLSARPRARKERTAATGRGRRSQD
jgi:hypothetical protein